MFKSTIERIQVEQIKLNGINKRAKNNAVVKETEIRFGKIGMQRVDENNRLHPPRRTIARRTIANQEVLALWPHSKS